MKNLKKLLCITLMAVAAFSAYTKEQYDPEGDFAISILDGGKSAVITKYGGSNWNVRIPMRILGLPVTMIGKEVFKDCTRLTGVTIPKGVTTIGEGAFRNCTSLAIITIPNSVTTIGEMAFQGCTSLTSVTIPNSVTSIGESAFFNCPSLTSITIPKGVTTIERSTFLGCTSLTSITIPNSVTSIGDSAFSWCISLTSVTIPKTVTSIGNWAFSDCPSLTSVTFEGIIFLDLPLSSRDEEKARLRKYSAEGLFDNDFPSYDFPPYKARPNPYDVRFYSTSYRGTEDNFRIAVIKNGTPGTYTKIESIPVTNSERYYSEDIFFIGYFLIGYKETWIKQP